jgi:hypothetical protein
MPPLDAEAVVLAKQLVDGYAVELRLHEHVARAAAGIVDAALIGLQHFHHQADGATRRDHARLRCRRFTKPGHLSWRGLIALARAIAATMVGSSRATDATEGKSQP